MMFLKLLLALLGVGFALMIWRSQRQKRLIKSAKQAGQLKSKSVNQWRP